MRPLVYSTEAAAVHGHGWTRCGTDIAYFENGVTRRDKTSACHSTLAFTWTCEYAHDVMYFAMCYPYTYSDLRTYLGKLQAAPLRSRHIRRQRLTLTIAGGGGGRERGRGGPRSRCT